MSANSTVSRRTVLRGIGTAMALPLLDAMVPSAARAARAAKAPPTRMAFVFVPNGKHMPDWTPTVEGRDFDLPPILEPLAAVKDSLNVFSGLTHDEGRAKGDGPGDHARAASSFLTGAHPYKTGGAKIRVGMSVDQFAARQIGKQTRFPSLELGCERGRRAGVCDSGYSCAYSHNISWFTEFTPMAKEISPRAVFERLFSIPSGGPLSPAQARRARYNRSILDLVLEDANRLRPTLGRNDQRKIDEYFTSIREIEMRMERAAVSEDDEPLPEPDLDVPEGTPKDYVEHIRLMYDLMALAFQTDSTRVVTFMAANAGSNRSYKHIGVSEGHHTLSHHQNNAEKQAKISRINQFHIRQFAYFLEKLKATPEGDGTLLDHAMIMYGSGLADGNRHEHHGLPVLLAGGGSGTIKTGRHIRVPDETPLANLFASMLERIGVPTESFGDSTGVLSERAG